MPQSHFEKLAANRLSERLADEVWGIAIRWDNFAKATVGRQIVRAVGSSGANTAEGVGRGSHPDNKRFVRTARGAPNETQHGLHRAFRRGALSQEQTARLKPLVDELAPRLNASLKSIGHFPDEE